ncbi:helix-turn-helix domain-containing protein [Nonomuraea sp. NPDC051941]|uniref:helix-turn-helix domain-containing protein n=1 Tax=Nonomuraea sp. NPDC051941 TaxID=3364373 RepID=UPI0037C70322
MSAARPAGKGRRVAARNRAALIAAAREVFANVGYDAPLSLVARAAGVGQSGLYRTFPTGSALHWPSSVTARPPVGGRSYAGACAPDRLRPGPDGGRHVDTLGPQAVRLP